MDMSPEQGKKPKFTSQTVQSNKAAAASQQAIVPDAVSHKKATGFTSDDFSKLSENENYRYAKNSKQIAHAVIAREKDGSKVALQYHLPKGSTPDTPEVRQLTHIEEITRFGMIRHRAKGEDNKTWYAKRYDHARIKLDDDDEDAVSVDFAYFSEEEQLGKEPFWGSAKEVPKFRKNLSEEVKKDFDAELADIKASTKGGHHMKVHSDSVRHRDAYNVY